MGSSLSMAVSASRLPIRGASLWVLALLAVGAGLACGSKSYPPLPAGAPCAICDVQELYAVSCSPEDVAECREICLEVRTAGCEASWGAWAACANAKRTFTCSGKDDLSVVGCTSEDAALMECIRTGLEPPVAPGERDADIIVPGRDDDLPPPPTGTQPPPPGQVSPTDPATLKGPTEPGKVTAPSEPAAEPTKVTPAPAPAADPTKVTPVPAPAADPTKVTPAPAPAADPAKVTPPPGTAPTNPAKTPPSPPSDPTP